MADAVKSLASILLSMAAGHAAAMTDPTLPPPALRASAAVPAASASAPVTPPQLRLQGLRPGQSALIDGRLRRVGERWGSHQLLRVEGQAAWLRDAEGRLLRLSLLPATEARP